MNALFLMVQGMNGNMLVKNESITIELPNRVPVTELEGLNKFFEKNWPEYRATMEKVSLSPFKDYQPLKR